MIIVTKLVVFVLHYNVIFFCNICSIIDSVFLKFKGWWRTPNTTDDVLDKFNTFEIIIVWELDFVKLVKLSKNLNKDCNLSTKPSYHESLSHTHQIWISSDRPIKPKPQI
jgi:hypothetical protein